LDPLVTVSPEGKIMDVNEAAVKVTGVTRDNLIGTDFWNYFTEPEKAREAYQQAFARGFVTDYPLTIRHTEGRLSHVLYNASVYKDASGKVLVSWPRHETFRLSGRPRWNWLSSAAGSSSAWPSWSGFRNLPWVAN